MDDTLPDSTAITGAYLRLLTRHSRWLGDTLAEFIREDANGLGSFLIVREMAKPAHQVSFTRLSRRSIPPPAPALRVK